MAFLKHPDMPRTMFGVYGLNPWNMLLFVILIAWLAQRRGEGPARHLPRSFQVLLIAFMTVIIAACVHLLVDRGAFLPGASTAGLVVEYLLNSVRWIIPGLLLFDGCRSRPRFLWGLLSILALYLLLSAQVVRVMPIDAMFEPELLERRSFHRLNTEIGYHRVDLSVMLAGASWALFSACALARSRIHSVIAMFGGLLVVYAQILTAGRGGYFAWIVVGLTIVSLR